ncbi:MAG: amidohydrolase family protein [Acidobacteriaceae bacterium]|nr:amidohydrolase family protein [Acidobacteriaceae bacterium]
MLAESNRLGVLANLRAGLHFSDLRLLLEDAQLIDSFDPRLLIAASDLPVPLPNAGAFAVAAALAGRLASECTFVSADPALLAAAQSAGMRTEHFDLAEVEATTAGLAAAGEPEPALAAARATTKDEGPTFILRGRIVTMDETGDDVIPRGALIVSKGRIVHILKGNEKPPDKFADATDVDTKATLYPGLLDLHNHFAYNAIPLWKVPKKFDDRNQWPRHQDYKPCISLPTTALASHPDTATALVRYVEVKAVMGGITTGQGIRTHVDGGPKLFRGIMRTVEQTDDERLPEARTNVLDLYAKDKSKVLQFRNGLKNSTAYFYHLSEGVDDSAYQHYIDLRDNDLIQESLVGIHSLALKPVDLKNMATQSAKVVWSPFSNLLLYGQTLDLKALVKSKVRFSIGCDWAPTGSKNLLQELKIARFEAKRQGADLDEKTLVKAVTCWAAEIVGWQDWLGTIREGALCDVIAIQGTSGDPYRQLINATEANVALVVVNGIPRYGDGDLMQSLRFDPKRPLERVKVASADKMLYLYREDNTIVTMPFKDARATLKDAMSDLQTFANNSKANLAALADDDEPPAFTVDLDMAPPFDDDDAPVLTAEAALAADFTKIADSIPLDSPEVGADDYWDRLKNQSNLPEDLAKELQNAYP